MRKQRPIDALFSKSTQGLLAATILEPDRWCYLSDLAKQLQVTPSTLQQPLSSLVGAGILKRRKEGNRVYFQADSNCPFLAELQGLMMKTVGLFDVLRDALEPLSAKIESAFVYGSMARSEERSANDVDLMVIGTAGLAELSPLLAKAEEKLRREINATCYTPDELRRKVEAKNHFLTAVLQKEKMFIIGDADDLGRLTKRRASRQAPDKQVRAKRPAKGRKAQSS